MRNTRFVNTHSDEWRHIAVAMTRDYFCWMNDQIQTLCKFSISEVVGMPLETYIASAAESICPQDQPHARFYLLLNDDIAVAMGGLRQLPGGAAEVVRLYTKPQYRGHGHGSIMLDRLIRDARDSGFAKLKLDTGVFMKKAIRIYASHGFTECESYEGAEPPPPLMPYWHFLELSLQEG